ncbi:hypothetical protein PIB30_102440 [Stylosanthes scabra]|uniref:TOM1-like protein 2 n=1 Tax=Stylosanthes scabra TaxID=79078 RepID=A0ABU6T034_9FABA|nr:hypothetical protein [Stylosanthes scabra]
MSENLMEKVNAIGERLKIGGVEVGRKMSAGMSSMSFKVKEFFHGQNHADRLVEEATSESLDEPDWSMNLHIYDLINDHQSLGAAEVVRAIKRRIMTRNNPRIQFLALVLLEALLKNCDNKGFMEVASEKVLDEMVKLIDDPLTVASNRNKALIMIEAWGESTTQLRYLPVFEETYKTLKSRGIGFPVRDNESLAPIFTPPPSSISAPDSDDIILPHPIRYDIPMRSFTSQQTTKEAFDVARNTIQLLYTILSSSPDQHVLRDEVTTSLVKECQRCECDVQRIAETAGNNEALLFQALNVNDEIQNVLNKYHEFNKSTTPPTLATFIPLQPVEPEDESAGWHRNEDDDDGLIRKPSGSSRVGLSYDDDMMDDLDEMIFGKRGVGDDSTNHHQSSKHDLISF